MGRAQGRRRGARPCFHPRGRKHGKRPWGVFLVGGASALLLGLRERTIDIDVKLDPEPVGVFEAIAELKERLAINVMLAAPDDFIPALPEWRERSEFIEKSGPVEFHHYDFYSQALAKVQRAHRADLSDARPGPNGKGRTRSAAGALSTYRAGPDSLSRVGCGGV